MTTDGDFKPFLNFIFSKNETATKRLLVNFDVDTHQFTEGLDAYLRKFHKKALHYCDLVAKDILADVWLRYNDLVLKILK